MSFESAEVTGKKLLEQFPAAKHTAKRIYQATSVALSRDHAKCEGTLRRVTPDDDFEYFYGYYDKSPWDATDRYMIALRVDQAYRSPAPKEPGTVCLIDTQNDNQVIEIGTTHAWNVQQGCMAQWLGPDFRTRIIYNDFRDGKYHSVIYNVEKQQEENVLYFPVYDVSRDGTFALSLDFNRLHRLRPGYGYSNLPDRTKGELCPDSGCVWKISIPDGAVEELFKYSDFASFEPDETMKDAEHKVNHLMISPDGKRFMILHRWFQNGRKHTRLVTANTDGTELFNLSDDIFVSHCYWKNNQEILSFLRKQETGDHYYLLKDKTHEYSLYWPRLSTDGHCSYSPDQSLIVTDSYPNRKRMAFVYICTEKQQQPVRIAKVFSPFKYDNDCRCDLHPRWNRAGDMICIDSVHEGKRAMYTIPVTPKDVPPTPGEKPELIQGKYKIAFVITNCKNSGPMNQTLNIIKNLDRNQFQPIVITLFQEDLGNSVIQRFLDAVPECFCLQMKKTESLIKGKAKLTKLLETIRPDLIHALGMPPYTMSLDYQPAIHLVTLRNYCYEDYPDKYGRKLGTILAHRDMKLIRKQVKKGETFVTCSESLSRIYREKENLPFDFIRNGVDIDQYPYADSEQKEKMRIKLNLPKDKKILLYSGQFIERKNQAFAIEGVLASEHADSILMILMGDGPDLAALKAKYEGDNRICFTGNITNVAEYLQSGDLYISASKSEGMPNGVLEAMASGLPVLLSDIPQHLEVLEINDQYGTAYQQDNKEDFIIKLNELLEKKNLRQMGKTAAETARKELTAKGMSNCYQKLYSNLIDKHDE